MFTFRTEGFCGCSAKYSPFFDSILAVASSANYGLVGNGRLYILGLTPNGIALNTFFDTQDGQFDLAWSEIHENQLVTACGDGSIKLFDIKLKNYPIKTWQEHKREVFSVNWNMVDKLSFCSSSWDGSIKIWSPTRPTSLLTLSTPKRSCIYAAVYSPHEKSTIASVSEDSALRLWDPRSPKSLVTEINAHLGAEVLTVDWNKYSPTILATGSVDKTIRTWDIRYLTCPIKELVGHNYAVKRLVWSPHKLDTLLSVSYDMTARVWKIPGLENPQTSRFNSMNQNPVYSIFNNHTEFVTGCDFSLWGTQSFAVTCAWDQTVAVWNVNSLIR